MGCSEPLAQQALIDSAIALCDQALIVQTDLDAVNVVTGTRDYEIELPSQQELSQVMRVWLDDRLLGPVPSFQVGEIASETGSPRYYFSRDIDELVNLRLFPTPEKDYPSGLVVRVATRPTRNATQFHKSLLTEWVDVVVDGALARLHDTPGQPFTAEAKALMLYQKVRVRIAAARIEALRGRVMSSMSVQMRPFV